MFALLAGVPFTSHAQHPVLADDFERSRGDLVRALTGNKYLRVAKGEGVGGGDALEATCKGSDRGSERIVEDVRMKRPGKEFTLCFDVKFAVDFDFAKGGKLLGLGPEKLRSTCTPKTFSFASVQT